MRIRSSRRPFFWITIISIFVIILSFACAPAKEEPASSTLTPTKSMPVPQISERLPVQIKTLEGYQAPPTKSVVGITAIGPTLPPPIQETFPATIGTLGGYQAPTLTPTDNIPCSEIVTTSDNNTPPKKVFSLACANTVVPENVLREVNFGGTGGAKDECVSPNSIYPVLYFYTERTDWLQPIFIVSCGWGREYQVEVNIKTPDNEILAETTESDDTTPGWLRYVFHPKIENNIGWYIFTFQGYFGELTVNVYVSMPDDSRMYYIENLGAYYLYGFSPNEKIRFFYYGGSAPKYQLKGWADYYVDKNGRLLIIVTSNQGYYVAVGYESGLVGNGYPIVK